MPFGAFLECKIKTYLLYAFNFAAQFFPQLLLDEGRWGGKVIWGLPQDTTD